jgi:hypothetical protein
LRSQARKRTIIDENEDFSQRRLGHIGANGKRVVEEGTDKPATLRHAHQ